MLMCPHCQHQALTHLAKCVLGPVKSVPCLSCGKYVSVHWAGILMLVPFLAGGLVALAKLPSWVAIVPFAIGAIAMAAIHAYCVPIVSRDS